LSFQSLVRVSTPYVIMLVGLTVLLIVFPDLSLFVPRLLGFKAAG
jgi:TRAP-type C4-dicarboxylate transport system permease large subunit